MIKEKATILVVDDTKINIDILLRILGRKYDIVVAANGLIALEVVKKESISLILLDIVMPEMDGYETCRQLKNNPKTAIIPVIFTTINVDEQSIETAYEVGGIDYITKPFKPKEILARVKTQLELRCLIDSLEFLATHDELTGIYNRRKFFELAELQFQQQQPLFATMIDIDHFKAINDEFGHPVGDKVIKSIVYEIQQAKCSRAILGRLGGEEFALICQTETIEKALESVEKIRLGVAQLFIEIEGKKIYPTISCGIAQKQASMDSIDQLLKSADEALYEAKGKGRNQSVFRV